MNCGYQGYDFGAYYPDSICIDGYLWDLDSCDEPGGNLYHGGDIGCPGCNTRKYLQYHGKSFTGNARQRRTQLRASMRKVQSWAKESP